MTDQTSGPARHAQPVAHDNAAATPGPRVAKAGSPVGQARGSLTAELIERADWAISAATPECRRLVGQHVLDTLGCIVGAADHPMAAGLVRFADLAGESGREESLALPGTVPPRFAVLADAVLAHVDEFDGLHLASAVAPAALVIPAAMVTAARHGRSGRQLTDAVLVGFEVAIEAGLRFAGPGLYAERLWPTPVFGTLGAAAATAYLLQLSVPQRQAAISIAAASMAGLLTKGVLADAHYLLPGRLAADGWEAAYLAAAGMTANSSLLDECAPTAFRRLLAAAGGRTEPHLVRCAFKRFPCARPLHALLVGLEELTRVGAAVEDATTLTVGLAPAVLPFVTAERQVASGPDAAASAVFAVAAHVAGRAEDPSFFREAPHGALPAGLPTVRLVADLEVAATFPSHWGARVTADMRDGRRVEVLVPDAPGAPDRPLSVEDVEGKFHRQIAAGGEGDSREWARRCLDLDSVPDVRQFRDEFLSLRPDRVVRS